MMLDRDTLLMASQFIVVLGAVSVMYYGLKKTFARLEAKQHGFGPNSVRVIGIILFLPMLLILSVQTDIPKEALVTLLGVVAGYMLSSAGSDQ